MTRFCVVTGSGSGIGAAMTAKLRAAGDTVVGIDLSGSEITADLSTAGGRASAVSAVGDYFDHIDVIVACAGIAAPVPKTIQVNYFGTVALLEGLRPLMAASAAPRVVAVTSLAAAYRPLRRVLQACVDMDEQGAVDQAEAAISAGKAGGLYATSKVALARWIRRESVSPHWAGHGIALNGVAPGARQSRESIGLTWGFGVADTR